MTEPQHETDDGGPVAMRVEDKGLELLHDMHPMTEALELTAEQQAHVLAADSHFRARGYHLHLDVRGDFAG